MQISAYHPQRIPGYDVTIIHAFFEPHESGYAWGWMVQVDGEVRPGVFQRYSEAQAYARELVNR